MTFDEHTNGQLRIGTQGDQIPLLPLPTETIPASEGPELASLALTLEDAPEYVRAAAKRSGATHVAKIEGCYQLMDAPQFRVWLESKQGSYWIPGTGVDEDEVRKNLTRTQRARVRAIKQVTTREAT